jgi:hypothetical protein
MSSASIATQAVRSRRGQGCAAAGGVGGKSSSHARRWSQARAASAQTSLSLLPDRRASSDICRTRSAGMRTCAGSTGGETTIASATTGSYGAEVQRHVCPALADDMPSVAAPDDTETGRAGGETGHAPEISALASGSRGMGASQVIGDSLRCLWRRIRTSVLLLYATKGALSSQSGPATFVEHSKQMEPARCSLEAPLYVSCARCG